MPKSRKRIFRRTRRNTGGMFSRSRRQKDSKSTHEYELTSIHPDSESDSNSDYEVVDTRKLNQDTEYFVKVDNKYKKHVDFIKYTNANGGYTFMGKTHALFGNNLGSTNVNLKYIVLYKKKSA